MSTNRLETFAERFASSDDRWRPGEHEVRPYAALRGASIAGAVGANLVFARSVL
ncbi:MAG: hypothetical protein H7Z42_01305 [Roseiflexaceae bacterium]|nr:hypothetical protein [Roseiflexaceae bacterium]